jgi:hypothetical protein
MTPPLFHRNKIAGSGLCETRARQSRDKQQDSDVVDGRQKKKNEEAQRRAGTPA